MSEYVFDAHTIYLQNTKCYVASSIARYHILAILLLASYCHLNVPACGFIHYYATVILSLGCNNKYSRCVLLLYSREIHGLLMCSIIFSYESDAKPFLHTVQ